MAGISSRLSPLNPSSGSTVFSSRKLKNADTASLFERKTPLDVFKDNLMALDEETFNSHTKTYFQVQLNELDQQCASIKKKILEIQDRQKFYRDQDQRLHQELQAAPFVVRAFTFDSLDKGVTSLIYKDQLADSLKSSLKQLEALNQKKAYFSQFTSFFDKPDIESNQLQETLTTQKQSLESEIVKLEASVARLERSVKDEKAISHLKYVNPGNADVFLHNLGTKVLNAVSGQKMPLQLSSEDELSKTRIELRLKQESLNKITAQIDSLNGPLRAPFFSKKIKVFLAIEKQYKDFSTNPAFKGVFEKFSGELKRRPNLDSFPEVVYTDPLPKARLQTLDVQVSFQDVEDDLKGRIQRRGSLEEVERDLEDLNLKKLHSFKTRQDNQEIKILGFLPSVESLVTSSLDPSGPLSLDPVDSSSIPPKFSHIVCIDLEKGSIFSEPLLVGDSFLYRQDISSDFDFLASFIEKTVSISPDDSWFVYLIKCFQVACVNNVSQAKEASFQKLKQLWLPFKDNSYFSKFQDYFSQNSLV